MFKRSKEQEKKGSEKREDLLVSFLKDAHFVFAIIIRWKKYTVEQIFAPKLSEAQIDEVTAIISQPIEDIASLMNNWFYSFYELSDDEIAYINGYFNAIVKQK